MKTKKYISLLAWMASAAAVIFIIYYILSSKINNGNINRNMQGEVRQAENAEDIAHNAKSQLQSKSAGAQINVDDGYVRDSQILAYRMKSEGGEVNIYEIYENGHAEKIKTLDIDPRFMREADRELLDTGITVDSYTEICSLIEDFSS